MQRDWNRFFLRFQDQKSLAWLFGLGMLCVLILSGYRNARPFSDEPEEKSAFHFSVDPNKADFVELQQLPGIGPRLADEIIRHRQENGPFGEPKNIRDVKGIGPKKHAAIQRYLQPPRTP